MIGADEGMRIVHRGALINQRGGVSALCFNRPRAINMKLASWVMRDEAVTCAKCLAKIKQKKIAAEIGKHSAPSKEEL